jgi:hypothetical protein
MVHHISEIFQSSERVHPGPLLSIHPSKHRTMSNPVTFHLGQIWYIQPNTTWACVPSFHGTRLKGPFVQISFLMPLSWVLLLTKLVPMWASTPGCGLYWPTHGLPLAHNDVVWRAAWSGTNCPGPSVPPALEPGRSIPSDRYRPVGTNHHLSRWSVAWSQVMISPHF